MKPTHVIIGIAVLGITAAIVYHKFYKKPVAVAKPKDPVLPGGIKVPPTIKGAPVISNKGAGSQATTSQTANG